jgi:hypothetical protein
VRRRQKERRNKKKKRGKEMKKFKRKINTKEREREMDRCEYGQRISSTGRTNKSVFLNEAWKVNPYSYGAVP